MDDARGPPKRVRRNRQSPNTLARSSASSSNSRHANEVVTRDNPAFPFQPLFNVQAPNTNESLLESANMGFQRYYSETIGIRLSHRPIFRHQRRRYDLPTIPMHGVPPNPPHGVVVPPQRNCHELTSFIDTESNIWSREGHILKCSNNEVKQVMFQMTQPILVKEFQVRPPKHRGELPHCRKIKAQMC
ncbi:uncharacterized protein LOC131650989 [Vicia villosa]|uniref:uncharacterized protein LOC131650989 n=1 Tax=Vicia villosa TaxID=3911 RepID=UPI00273CD38E|nr:uncharacterized protein LOC131650989 [Vicia villosa]